jgi:ribonuclease VapC
MSSSVLDASALLAYLRDEPGGERVLSAILSGAVMSTANFAEVGTWFMRNGADEPYVRDLRKQLVFTLTPVDDDLAIRAAALEPITRAQGLSLGDRFCLALAARLGVAAVTADRLWQPAAAQAGIQINLIR